MRSGGGSYWLRWLFFRVLSVQAWDNSSQKMS
jgi:hypothetical protein